MLPVRFAEMRRPIGCNVRETGRPPCLSPRQYTLQMKLNADVPMWINIGNVPCPPRPGALPGCCPGRMARRNTQRRTFDGAGAALAGWGAGPGAARTFRAPCWDGWR